MKLTNIVLSAFLAITSACVPMTTTVGADLEYGRYGTTSAIGAKGEVYYKPKKKTGLMVGANGGFQFADDERIPKIGAAEGVSIRLYKKHVALELMATQSLSYGPSMNYGQDWNGMLGLRPQVVLGQELTVTFGPELGYIFNGDEGHVAGSLNIGFRIDLDHAERNSTSTIR